MITSTRRAPPALDIQYLDRRESPSLSITYGAIRSPWGEAVLATARARICALLLRDPGAPESAAANLQKRFPGADLQRVTIQQADWGDRLNHAQTLPLLLCGTPFQLKVWRTLAEIPHGQTCSYSAVAEAIGRPKAFRAVGSAVGANPMAVLIPCHRVLPAGGGLGGYHWGTAHKQSLLRLEGLRT